MCSDDLNVNVSVSVNRRFIQRIITLCTLVKQEKKKSLLVPAKTDLAGNELTILVPIAIRICPQGHWHRQGGPGGTSPPPNGWAKIFFVKIEELSSFTWFVLKSWDITTRLGLRLTSSIICCWYGRESTRSSTASSSTPWPHSKSPGSHRQICSYWSPSS